MNIAGNERMLDKLAAEYVLGTLKGHARRRFETWLRQDPMVQRATVEWRERLLPMAQFSAAATPRAEVWRAIVGRLNLAQAAADARTLASAPAPATSADSARASDAVGVSGSARASDLPSAAVPGTASDTTRASAAASTTPRATGAVRDDRRAFWRGLRDDLSFWRGLGLTSSAVAAILVAILATRAPVTPAPVATAPATSYVAMLADDKAQAVAVATGDETHHRLTVRVVLPQTLAADKSLELWAVPKSGAPRALGLIEANGSVSLPLPADATPQTVAMLAISLEPKGGSPNPNSPSGPIVFKGAWVQL